MTYKVTVIIPSFNHAAYVELTIRSVFAQTYKNIELIVVDDCSNDDSPVILKKLSEEFGFKLILKEKNEGVCAALNDGLKFASGELFVMFGSDDIMPKGRIEEQVQIMTESQELDVIAGSVEKIDQDGRPFGLAHSAALGEISFEQMLSRNLILAPTAMIRKSVFERFGVYDPRFVLEDYYMWLKVLNGGGVIRIFDKIWAFYRVTGGNSIAKLRWYLKGATQVLSIYKNHPLAELHLNKMTFRYLVKVALLDGKSSMTESAEIPTRPSKVQRVLLHSISVLPQRLRLMIYERIGG